MDLYYICIYYICTYHVSILVQRYNVLSHSHSIAGLVASGAIAFLAAGMSYFYMAGGE